jgi:hypothetical protein
LFVAAEGGLKGQVGANDDGVEGLEGVSVVVGMPCVGEGLLLPLELLLLSGLLLLPVLYDVLLLLFEV